MPQENVEIVRRFFESYRPDDPAEALAYLAPDVVYEIGQEVPARGRDEVRAMWERWQSSWDEIEMTPAEFVDAGDHVIVEVHYSGRGRGSGIEFDAVAYDVYTLRGGLCVRKLEFNERSQALEAAGLQE
jgi:ketosteroid isomerase-like protein